MRPRPGALSTARSNHDVTSSALLHSQQLPSRSHADYPRRAGPRAAIVQVDGGAHVYVQQDPEAFELRQLTTGDSNDLSVAIVNGLREGERIVTVGAENLTRK